MAGINPKSLENLTPRIASDGATNLQKISVKVPSSLLNQLDRIEGDRSAKIRAAIKLFIAQQNLSSDD
jgi:metal-responsive CopG/Arc/MetJ family transcriptional regulator